MLSVAHVLIGLLVILLVSFESSLYILDISPLSDTCFSDIFSCSVVCLFIFFTGSFEEQTFYTLISSIHQVSLFWVMFLVSNLRLLCLALCPDYFLLCFIFFLKILQFYALHFGL